MPLIECVLDAAVNPARCVPATLEGYRVAAVAEGPFPMIVADGTAQAGGMLFCDVTPEEQALFDYYEGRFGYELSEVTVLVHGSPSAALVYLPSVTQAKATLTEDGPWDFTAWQDRWALMSVRAATDLMALRGTRFEAHAGRLLPFYRARAWAKELGAQPAPQTLRRGNSAADVAFMTDHRAYDGFFRVRNFDLKFRRFDGDWSAPIPREAFVAYDAALVLPYDPQSDHLLLIEQLRYGPLMRNDPAPWVLEPIAGLVDAGETPENCARREAEEEAGLTLADLRPMVKVYASPGYSSEFFHCFLGVCDLSGYVPGLGGLADENEDIRSHVISFDAAMALVESGEANAGPLAMMILWLAAHRAALRGTA